MSQLCFVTSRRRATRPGELPLRGAALDTDISEALQVSVISKNIYYLNDLSDQNTNLKLVEKKQVRLTNSEYTATISTTHEN